MPQCAFHPKVETNVRCAECERYICSKDMVETPVGYKCRECARPARGQLAYIKPKQLLIATAAALIVGVLGGLVVGQLLHLIRWSFFILMIMYGAGIAEVVRRASGGHRGTLLGIIAAIGAVGGGFLGGFGVLNLVFVGLGAFGYMAWGGALGGWL